MDNKVYDYSKTDIAKGAGISRTTLSSAWENLEKPGLVIEDTRSRKSEDVQIEPKAPRGQEIHRAR
ncbi:Uncharacterised protein [uncultured archaeon]|nr:Uncharacterised protein [uncultured archaeon]